jgi:hypothetical protein
MIMLINGRSLLHVGMWLVPWAAFRASFRASIWAVIFTLACPGRRMQAEALLKAKRH